MEYSNLSQEMNLPQSDFAEMAVLGSVLMEPGLLYEVSQVIKMEDFYKDSHKKIYKVMYTLLEEGREIDLITVSNALKSEGILEAVGGAAYLTVLCDTVPSAANALSYAHIIKDKAVKRRLIAISDRISHEAQAEEKDASLLLDEA